MTAPTAEHWTVQRRVGPSSLLPRAHVTWPARRHASDDQSWTKRGLPRPDAAATADDGPPWKGPELQRHSCTRGGMARYKVLADELKNKTEKGAAWARMPSKQDKGSVDLTQKTACHDLELEQAAQMVCVDTGKLILRIWLCIDAINKWRGVGCIEGIIGGESNMQIDLIK